VHVELLRLTKRYGAMRALDEVSLAIPPGRIVAVIGLNGAGKTTLLRTLAGILAPTHGEVRYDGERFVRARLDLRRRFMFIADFPALYANHNVLQHVVLMLRVYDRADAGVEDAIVSRLREFDLLPLAETPLGQLSRGQIYKAAFTGLLAVRPELWLLDEPFASGLDPQGLAMVKQHARAAASAGGTVIYSTQILEVAEKFADMLCVIDRGRLAATFTRADLDALPAQGPESLESRLRQFREVPV
jgi:ABC-type multidrug transport system ATPase subunit